MNLNNVLGYVKKPVSGKRQGSTYIDIMQEAYPSNSASMDETAELIDSIFDVAACPSEQAVPKTVSEVIADASAVMAKVQAFVATGGTRSACSISPTMDYECYLRVYLSNWLEDYVLKLTNGVELSKTHQLETIVEQYSVNSASYVKLQVPSSRLLDDSENDEVDDAKFVWVSCIPLEGQDVPNIYCNGTELYWNGKCTGTIDTSYPAEYDRVRVRVTGMPDGKTFGECKALGFYHSLFDEEDLEPPDTDSVTEQERSKYCGASSGGGGNLDVVNKPVRCYKVVRVTQKCNCSNGTWDEYDYEVDVTCPDGVGCGATPDCVYFVGFEDKEVYVDCGETGEVNKKSFYEAHCCYPPEVSLPKCAEVYRKNPGGQDLDPAVKAEYIAKYGDAVSFIGLMPEDGDCGNTITRQSIPQTNCCSDVDDIVFDTSATPSVLPSNESIVLYADGGRAPYTWTTSNKATYFLGGKQTIDTLLPYTRLYAKSSFCGHTTVTIDDGCSNPKLEIRSDLGEWEEIPGHTCEYPGLGSPSYSPAYTLEFAPFHTAAATITVGSKRQFESIWGTQINEERDACCGNLVTGVIDCNCIMSTATPVDSEFCLSWKITFPDYHNCDMSTYGIRRTTFYCEPDYDSVFRHRVYQMINYDKIAWKWVC